MMDDPSSCHAAARARERYGIVLSCGDMVELERRYTKRGYRRDRSKGSA